MKLDKNKINILSIFLITITVVILTTASLYIKPKTDFQVSRAMTHLEQIGKAPHSVGMKEHDNVRQYILEQLDNLEIEWELQEDLYFEKENNNLVKIKNIVARIPGKKPDNAIAVAAHYDSVSSSFGTNDNGVNVAAMLECINIIKNEPQLENDIIFLFTDAEEEGLMGMKSFANNHKFSKDIKFLMNFEARGTSGASLMFETTPGNLQTIKKLNKASSNIISNSLMTDIYNLMDNDTDYTVLKDKKIQGLNYAYVGGGHNYHTLGDNLDNISLISFQQQGHHMLSSIRYYGNDNLDNLYSSKDGVFFNIFNQLFIVYSHSFMIFIKLLALVLAITSILFALRKKIISGKGLIIGFISQLLLGVAFYFIIPLLQKGSIIFGKDIYVKLTQEAYNSMPLFIGMSLFIVLLIYLFYIPLTKKINTITLFATNLIWFAIFSVLTFFFVQGGSFLFDWVLLSCGIVLLIIIFRNENKKTNTTLLSLIPFWLFIILVLQLVLLITDTFSLLDFFITGIILLLILNLAMPQFHDIINKKKIFSSILLLLSISFILSEYITTPVKISNNNTLLRTDYNIAELFYDEYADGNKEAYWNILDSNKKINKSLEKKVDIINFPITEVELLEEKQEDNNRILKFKIIPPIPSSKIFIDIYNQKNNILSVTINDTHEVLIDELINLEGLGLDKNDYIIEIVAKDSTDVLFSITDNIFGLEEIENYGIYDEVLEISSDFKERLFLGIYPCKDYKY
ncbi:MAG: M28 family peptidase [Eubacteriales bacterium]